jgi:RNA polymerase sigma-70 factor (ECF subfamily)
MKAHRSAKAKKRAASERIDVDVDLLETQAPSMEARMDQKAAVAAVRDLILSLPEEQAEALLLHAVVGLTVAEIAKTMGVPFDTAKSRIRLSRLALRRKMSGMPALALVEDER